MTITQFLLVFLGLATWDLIKHLYRGAKLWRLHRRAQRWDQFLAWRRARVAGSRITYPSARETRVKPPYLGLDVPEFVTKKRQGVSQ